MIGKLAFGLATSSWGRYLMAALAVLAGVGAWGVIKERKGRRAERSRRSIETMKTLRRMQDAGARVATDRMSVADSMRDGTF